MKRFLQNLSSASVNAPRLEVAAYPWRLFALLLAASVIGVLALLPYLSAVLGPSLMAHPLPLPLPVIALVQAVVNFSIFTGLGLLLARKLALGAPYLENWVYGRAAKVPARVVITASGVGVLLGLVTLVCVRSPMGAALTALPIASEGAIPVWKRFLACFYGGLDEEILTRLFLLSLVLWFLRLLWQRESAQVSLFWLANLLVAVAFGAGHLPLAARIAPLTPQLVSVVILLNMLCALPFGYLYWRRGLEAAMIAHFSADLILHVIGPAF
ncbi:MAG: CPBP family glutamic-type intramembrane protease [Verrucomicrobiota bacterium]|nr:CPBP family glutamic-type intramembrane protease [Verrucomicrobiota bacterium]